MWVHTFGGPGAYDEVALGVPALSEDGSVAVPGVYGGTIDFGGGRTPTPGNQKWEAFLLKLASDGTVSFLRTIKNSSDPATSETNANAAGIGQDGSIYVVGTQWGKADFDPDGAGDVQDAGAMWRGFISKYNASGARAWTKFVASTNEARLTRIAIGRDGSLWPAGTFAGTADFDPGTGKQDISAPGPGMFLLRLDVSGGFLRVWTWTGGSSGRMISDVSLAFDGAAFVSGDFWEGALDLDPSPAQDFRATSTDSYDAFLVKLKGDGSYASGHQLGGSGSENSGGVAALEDGGALLAGFFGSKVNFSGPSGNDVRDPALGSLFVTRLGPNREYRWTVTVGSSASSAAGVALLRDGFLVTGGVQGSGDFDPGPGTDRVTVATGAAAVVSRYLF